MSNRSPAKNLPPDPSDNARKSGEELLQHPAIVAVIKTGNAMQASRETGTPHPTIYEYLERIREDGLAHHLPARYQRKRRSPAGSRPTPSPANRDEIVSHALSAHARQVFTYPVVAHIPAGAFDVVGINAFPPLLDPIDEYTTDIHVPRGDRNKPPPFAFIVRGDSMTNPQALTHFPDGSRVLVNPSLEATLNDFVAVMDLTDGSITLKQLVNKAKLPERDLWLQPLNSDYAPIKFEDDMHEVVGVVVDATLPLFRKSDLIRRVK